MFLSGGYLTFWQWAKEAEDRFLQNSLTNRILWHIFLKNMMIMDETWIYHFDPEQKMCSLQWRPVSSSPKKAKVTPSSWKIMSCFWDYEGKIMTNYLDGKCANHHRRLQLEFADKTAVWICAKKVLKTQLWGPPYAWHRLEQAAQRAERCGFEILQHPVYSTDLASSNFFLFLNLKKSFKGRCFHDTWSCWLKTSYWLKLGPYTFKDFWRGKRSGRNVKFCVMTI